MAKIPDFKRVTAEDFPEEQQALVQKLGFIINSFHEQVRNILNKKVDFDNLAQEVKVLEFGTNEFGEPLNELSFRSNLNSRVTGILPVRVVITSSNTQSATELPVITWTQSVGLVTITNISGLLPETRYELTLLTL